MNIAEAICNALEYNDVAPCVTFIASAGRDYGQVQAWQISDRGEYALKYGNNATTNFDIGESVNDDDLGKLLIVEEELDGADRLIARANVFGLGKVEAAPADSSEPCAVLIEHSYYGPYTRTDAARDERGDIIEFDNAVAAQKWIAQKNSMAYVTAHNETGRPEYKVVKL